jgi:hypothetical protein
MKVLENHKKSGLLYASDLSDFYLAEMTVSFSSAERTRRVKKEFERDVRAGFIKNLALLYEKEIKLHFPKSVVKNMKNGVCPAGFSIHHQLPRCIGGQNYNKAAFAKMVKNIPETEKEKFEKSRLKNKIDHLLSVPVIMEEKGVSKDLALKEARRRFYRLFSGYLVLMKNSRHQNLHQNAFDFQIKDVLDTRQRDTNETRRVWILKTEALFGMLYAEPNKEKQFSSCKKEIQNLMLQRGINQASLG